MTSALTFPKFLWHRNSTEHFSSSPQKRKQIEAESVRREVSHKLPDYETGSQTSKFVRFLN